MIQRLPQLVAPGLEVALAGEGDAQLEMGLPGVVGMLHLPPACPDPRDSTLTVPLEGGSVPAHPPMPAR
jgi:hypothetical protein